MPINRPIDVSATEVAPVGNSEASAAAYHQQPDAVTAVAADVADIPEVASLEADLQAGPELAPEAATSVPGEQAAKPEGLVRRSGGRLLRFVQRDSQQPASPPKERDVSFSQLRRDISNELVKVQEERDRLVSAEGDKADAGRLVSLDIQAQELQAALDKLQGQRGTVRASDSTAAPAASAATPEKKAAPVKKAAATPVSPAPDASNPPVEKAQTTAEKRAVAKAERAEKRRQARDTSNELIETVEKLEAERAKGKDRDPAEEARLEAAAEKLRTSLDELHMQSLGMKKAAPAPEATPAPKAAAPAKKAAAKKAATKKAAPAAQKAAPVKKAAVSPVKTTVVSAKNVPPKAAPAKKAAPRRTLQANRTATLPVEVTQPLPVTDVDPANAEVMHPLMQELAEARYRFLKLSVKAEYSPLLQKGFRKAKKAYEKSFADLNAALLQASETEGRTEAELELLAKQNAIEEIAAVEAWKQRIHDSLTEGKYAQFKLKFAQQNLAKKILITTGAGMITALGVASVAGGSLAVVAGLGAKTFRRQFSRKANKLNRQQNRSFTYDKNTREDFQSMQGVGDRDIQHLATSVLERLVSYESAGHRKNVIRGLGSVAASAGLFIGGHFLGEAVDRLRHDHGSHVHGGGNQPSGRVNEGDFDGRPDTTHAPSTTEHQSGSTASTPTTGAVSEAQPSTTHLPSTTEAPSTTGAPSTTEVPSTGTTIDQTPSTGSFDPGDFDGLPSTTTPNTVLSPLPDYNPQQLQDYNTLLSHNVSEQTARAIVARPDDFVRWNEFAARLAMENPGLSDDELAELGSSLLIQSAGH